MRQFKIAKSDSIQWPDQCVICLGHNPDATLPIRPFDMPSRLDLFRIMADGREHVFAVPVHLHCRIRWRRQKLARYAALIVIVAAIFSALGQWTGLSLKWLIAINVLIAVAVHAALYYCFPRPTLSFSVSNKYLDFDIDDESYATRFKELNQAHVQD